MNKATLYLTFLFSMAIVLMSSCDEKESKPKRTVYKTEGIKVAIDQSAGEMYKAINFLPLLTNVATFDDIPSQELECWIISKKIKESKDIDVDIFALLLYDDGRIKKNIVLAVPSNKKYRTIYTTDLMDFSLEHTGVKEILTSWIKLYKGSKSSVILQWKDKQEALRYLQKYTKLNKDRK